MTQERLEILIQKLLSENCTEDEMQELEDFYRSLDVDSNTNLPEYVTKNWETFADNEYHLLKTALRQRSTSKQVHSIRFYKIAAVWIGLAALALLSLYFLKDRASHVNTLPAAISYNAEGNTAVDSRYLLLPDSSVVILHAGSSLQMDSIDFNKNQREVVLSGEAFFDVKHNAAKPFIVLAGKARITVLGTAFSINASKDSIAVTVTRGKVKVEDGGKEIMITPNRQVAYSHSEEMVLKSVVGEEQVNWIRAGLVFNHERLDSIAGMLEKRYQVNVKLNNEAIRRCRISAGNPFTGTESIEEILSLICPAVNATFTQKGSTIIIDGPGCDAL